MNRHMNDHNRMRRFTLHAIFGTLFILVFLALSTLAVEQVGETGFLFHPASLFSGRALHDLFAAPAGGSWIATQGVAGILVLLALLLAAFGVASVAFPRNMKPYWMKQLVHAPETAVKSAAAKELGRTDDPDALLLLLDVAEDEGEEAEVRDAAAEALREMSAAFGKQGSRVAALEPVVRNRDPQGIIGLLQADVCKAGKGNVLSAYVVGRQFMKLGRYSDARDWLRKARSCDSKILLHGNRIDRLIDTCNERLLVEGDALFTAGEYHGAREHFALLSYGLVDHEKRQFAVYLRSACVYCKLQDYGDADQAVLQALRFDQETDKSLALMELLHKLRSGGAKGKTTEGGPDRIRQSIDEYVTELMRGLRAEQRAMAVA